MKMNISYLLASFFLLGTFMSCGDDDSDIEVYVPLEITTEEDIVQVSTLATIEIFIFNNDTNIPQDGTLTITAPANGEAIINNNESLNNLRDDIIFYDPSENFSGQDSFQYTICLNDGTNCKTATVSIDVFNETPVTLDLELFPFDTLSEYNFFSGDIINVNAAYGVLEYVPITPLFTDYAKKDRYVWIPPGEKARYVADNKSLDFPTGSALVKVFYYDNVINDPVLPDNSTRIMETRVMVKMDSGWEFAEYIWNDAQTEAFLDTSGNGGFKETEWILNGENRFVNYRFPAMSQCTICHNIDTATPLGIKPESINSEIVYSDGLQNQLQKLIDFGYLENALPSTIIPVADWTDLATPVQDRMRAYIDINCGNCHQDGGQGDYRGVRLAYAATENIENIGVCVDADTAIPDLVGQKLIAPRDIENSIIYFRMAIEGDGQYKMPQFGQNLRHTEGLALMEDWINSLTEDCD
jgi:uncharacterized repeat protein (TIGR03806 family)